MNEEMDTQLTTCHAMVESWTIYLLWELKIKKYALFWENEDILKGWETYPSRDVGNVNSKQKEKQEQRSRSITIYIKGNRKWMMRFKYQEQEEYGKVMRWWDWR